VKNSKEIVNNPPQKSVPKDGGTKPEALAGASGRIFEGGLKGSDQKKWHHGSENSENHKKWHKVENSVKKYHDLGPNGLAMIFFWKIFKLSINLLFEAKAKNVPESRSTW
jgi:hypothetical protein